MNTVSKVKNLFYGLSMVLFLTSFNACTEELVVPNPEVTSGESHLTNRADGPVSIFLVKQKVSERDNIPLNQILTCIYLGQTEQGHWRYLLTTLFYGPKIYIVTSIIGDDCEGA